MTPFNLNSLKGRMAEHLIQDLFIQSGYHVFNYGLERLHPSLSKLIKTNQRNTAKALRFMPDFVVQHSGNGDLFYMEVKFRSNGCFGFDEQTIKAYPYHNAWFVIVSPHKIQCIHYKRLIKGFTVNPSTNYSLLKVKSFQFDAEIVREYEAYAQKLFARFAPEK